MLKVELDFPAPELFPNRSKGKHWATLHKHKTAARDAGFMKTIRLGPPPTFITAELYLIITFEMPDKRHRDADNCLAAAKSALDGVAIALRVAKIVVWYVCVVCVWSVCGCYARASAEVICVGRIAGHTLALRCETSCMYPTA